MEWTYTNFPFYSLYGDGTLVVPGAQIEIYPPPALPAISSRGVDEAGIQAILEEAIAAVQDVPADLNDLGFMSIADASTTVITVSAGGVDRTIRVYALSELSERPDGMPESEYEARLRLQELVTKLTGSTDWLPEGSLGLRARTSPLPPACSSGTTVPSRTSPRSRCPGRSTKASPASAPRLRPAGIGAASRRAPTGMPSTRPPLPRTRSPPGRMRAGASRSCSGRSCPTRPAAEQRLRSLGAPLRGRSSPLAARPMSSGRSRPPSRGRCGDP